MKRALVLGGSGFIGRHLTSRLGADGWEVFVATPEDRHADGKRPEGQAVEVAALDSSGIGAALDTAQPAVVFNLAAAGVSPRHRAPEDLVAGNAGIVASLMTALEGQTGVKVIHTGSWSEYSDPTTSAPISEDHPIAPSSVYGAAKAGATLLGRALGHSLGIPFTALRVFHVYGEGEAAHRLLPYLVERLTRGEPAELTIGTQIRDFVYVHDVVDALVSAAAADADSSVYNIATGTGTTVRDVALMAAAEMGVSPDPLRFGALETRTDEPAVLIGDPTRFFEATGWSAQTSVADGVRRTIEGISSAPTSYPARRQE